MSIATIREKFQALEPLLDERQRRLWAAAEARSLGRGGKAVVRQATGIGPRTLWQGDKELKALAAGEGLAPGHVRRAGGGRKRLADADATLVRDLESLIEPTTRGDPRSPLRWTTKSVRRLAAELCAMGHHVSADTVDRLLHSLHYSLQAPGKENEGRQQPDRDAQFRHINEQTKAFQRRRSPVVFVDTKKKELVGDFKNGGREWHAKGNSPRVNVHDFPTMAEGKAIPYGVFDAERNEGWVNVGVDHDTPEFAVESLRRWWKRMGRGAYPSATELLVVADAGGSNAARSRVWKARLQELANETALRISVCHYPPGTSKWNKIEHRLFSNIALNWRGKPLRSYETIINLIGSTTTNTGLHVLAELDRDKYPTGVSVSNPQMEALCLHHARFHGEWNYRLSPAALSLTA